MVGILQFFDFGQASSSRKLLVHGRRSNGFQPPRNSLELPMDAYKSFPAVHEAVPNSQYYSDKEDYQHEFQLNYLIDEARFTRKAEQYKKPSIVARLMGMDALPSDLKPITHAKESNHELRATKPNCISSSRQNSDIMKTMKHLNAELLPYDIKQDLDRRTIFFGMDKPRPREHPQEELLQKFKKEFEAWQASKIWERSESLQLGDSLPSKRFVDILPQENIRKDKLSRNDDPKKISLMKNNLEPRYHVSSAGPYMGEQEDFSCYEALVTNPGQNGMKEDDFRGNMKLNSHAPVYDGGLTVSDSSRRIVILKPCYEMTGKVEESLSSPMMLEKQENMHEFLQQVKERLITEIQGKPQLKTTTRWNDSGLFVSERSADSEQISLRLVKQIGEAVPDDNNIILLRSKLTRSYRNEIQPSGQCSPEFINRGTIKSLSERMKNVMKSESDVRSPFISKARSFLSHSNREEEKFSSMQYFDKKHSRKTSYLEDKKMLNESRSFRHIRSRAYDDEGECPRNLMRSYSAPVSGTEFGKLLLEDKNALTAVHIHRKHEKSENSLMSGRKMKKEGFNIKSSVSSLRQNLSLKGKLFGKRIHLLHELAEHELLLPMKASETTPSAVPNLRFAQDNSTEVPPSPASVCSSSYDEICGPYYPSPVSPLEALFTEDHIHLPPPEELNSNLLELNTLEEEPKCDQSEEARSQASKAKPAGDPLTEFEYNAKSYIREILVASGLLERNYFHEALWEWESPRNPISMLVFDEVEEIYQNNVKLDFTAFLLSNCHVSHRILFDLLNEVLLRAIQSTRPSSTFKKWFIAPRRLPHGDELLETLWRQIQLYINPSVEDPCPVESIVGRDLRASWSGMLHEDIDTICLEVESLISENLIDELVCNLSF